MFNRRLTILLKITLCFLGGQAMGQAARSPFYSFGLGERYSTALVQHQSMGGVGVSNPEYWYINNLNPALLIYNRVTTFQFGMIGESRTQTNGTFNEHSGSGNLGYLALAIPVKQLRWTSAVALMPYTRLNYSFTHVDSIAGTTTNTVNVQESGTGGIDQLTWSNGVYITKNLSLGLKAAYLFSSTNTEYSNQLTNTNQQVTIYPNIKERTYVSDFQFSPAASIHLIRFS